MNVVCGCGSFFNLKVTVAPYDNSSRLGITSSFTGSPEVQIG